MNISYLCIDGPLEGEIHYAFEHEDSFSKIHYPDGYGIGKRHETIVYKTAKMDFRGWNYGYAFCIRDDREKARKLLKASSIKPL